MMPLKPKIYKKGGKSRSGKGFSREELKKVNLSVKNALKFHLSVDLRRRTVYQDNITTLQTFLARRKESNLKAKSAK